MILDFVMGIFLLKGYPRLYINGGVLLRSKLDQGHFNSVSFPSVVIEL